MAEEFVILLVEDSPGDANLTALALKESKLSHKLYVVSDGNSALSFLKRTPPYEQVPQPDMIMLDLNLPGKSGIETLAEIKSDPIFSRIPVIVLTVSQEERDILESYDLYANGYIIKPVDNQQFFDTIKNIKEFWFSVVKLPTRTRRY